MDHMEKRLKIPVWMLWPDFTQITIADKPHLSREVTSWPLKEFGAATEVATLTYHDCGGLAFSPPGSEVLQFKYRFAFAAEGDTPEDIALSVVDRNVAPRRNCQGPAIRRQPGMCRPQWVSLDLSALSSQTIRVGPEEVLPLTNTSVPVSEKFSWPAAFDVCPATSDSQ
jgi:hypothetical protein